MNTKNYISTKEAAARLGLTVQRIRQLVAEGSLEGEKIGRDLFVRRHSVATFVPRPPGRPPDPIRSRDRGKK